LNQNEIKLLKMEGGSEKPVFVRYGSIKTFHKTRTGPFERRRVIFTEKIHGSHYEICFHNINGEMVLSCAKRSGFIDGKENFFNHRAVMEMYEENLSRLMESLRGAENFTELLIMGEMYGGYYHGEKAPGHKTVQKSKFSNYCKENDFAVFDIRLNGKWFTWDEVIDYCENQLHMNHVPEIARGLWKDLKNFDVESQQSLLALRHNGNDGKHNPIEGVVVRLENPEFITWPAPPGSLRASEEMDFRLKWKAREMLEGNYHDDQLSTDDKISLMMNQPRFEAYLSKVGEDEIIDGNIGKHIREMVADVFVDIKEEHSDFDEKTLKSYRAPLSNAARRLIFNYRCDITAC